MDERVKGVVAGGVAVGVLLAMNLFVPYDATSCGAVAYQITARPFDGQPDENLSVDNGHHYVRYATTYSNSTKQFLGRSQAVGITFEAVRADTSTADSVISARAGHWTQIVSNWQWSKGDGSWRNEIISALVEGGQGQRLDSYVFYDEQAAKEFASTGQVARGFTDMFLIGCQEWVLDTQLHVEY